MLTMRRYLLILFLSIFALFEVVAQRERNYIYILDSSNSMLTSFKVNGTPLWNVTLDYLHADIDRQSPTSTINIIPFQGKVYPITSCLKSEFNWDKFYNQVKDYPQTLTGTNICDAWDEAIKLQDPNKDNYLVLLTDGEDNKKGVDAVCKRIREWCEKVRNTYGYYVMLSNEAMHPKIVEEVKRCNKLFIVEAKDGIKPFGSVEKSTMTFNTLEPKDIKLPFSAAGTFKAHIECEDENFDVKLVDGVIKNGRAVVRVSAKGDLSQLDDILRLAPKLVSDEVNILNPDLDLIINNQPERLLSIISEEQDLGEAEWYDSFLWNDAKLPDTLNVDLQAVFNEPAMKAGSEVTMVVSSRDKEGNRKPLDQHISLLWNGAPLGSDAIKLASGQPSVLSVIFDAEAAEGKHYLEIATADGSAYNLERINEDAPNAYAMTLRAEYDVDMNPLKVFCIWLGIILLAALFLWFVIMKPLIYPSIKIKKLQIESEPIYKNVTIKGCRKVVFTNKRQSQGLLNRIFTGEVKYAKDDMWDTEWYLTAGTKKDRVRANGVSGYTMNPPGYNLQKMETVVMKSNQTGKVIKVTPV